MDRDSSPPIEIPSSTSLEVLDAERERYKREQARMEAERKQASDAARERAEYDRDKAALDELATKVDEVRERVRRQEEWKLGELESRWESHRSVAEGFDLYLEVMDRVFKGFYRRSPDADRKKLEQYEKMMGQLRVACSLYQRDIRALTEQPSSAVLETLDVQMQEIDRLINVIRAINPDAPMRQGDIFSDKFARLNYQAGERALCERFACSPEELARDEHEISDSTKVYAGRIHKDLFSKLRHVEHVLIGGSEQEVVRMTVPVGSARTYGAFEHAFQRQGENLGQVGLYSIAPDGVNKAEVLQKPPDGWSDIELVRLNGSQLGQRGQKQARNINYYAEEAGLRFCNLVGALTVQLKLLELRDPAGRGLVPCHDDSLMAVMDTGVLQRGESDFHKVRDLEIRGAYTPNQEWWLVIPKEKKKKRFGIF